MYLYYLFALIVIGIDQLTKWLVIQKMDLYESIPIIDHFFYITSHRNAGAAWGILQGQMVFFYIVTIFVIIGLVYYMEKYARNNKLTAVSLSLILGGAIGKRLEAYYFSRTTAVSLSLILGGAIGNFIDRLLRQEVVDFLDVMIFKYDFPIFNVADSCLVIGVILIFIATIMEEKSKGQEKA